VEIVSGRDRDTLGEWLADVPITLRAEHGMWLRRRGESRWTAQFDLKPEMVEHAAAMIEGVAAAHGGLVERKRSGAAWHYRGLDVPEVEVSGVVARLAREARPRGLEVLKGACVVELRSRGVHKGDAVKKAKKSRPRARILALGDDVTDEDMFQRLRAADVGVLVGRVERPTSARVRLSDVAAARALLATIAG
jgi:trehalose 6-phosphate synthase/phosphatase